MRIVTTQQIKQLIQTCANKTEIDVRDAALITILSESEYTVKEIRGLKKVDAVKSWKGDLKSNPYMIEWLELLPQEAEYIFVCIFKGRHIADKPLGINSIEMMIRHRCQLANLQPLSPKDFLNYRIRQLLEKKEVPLFKIKDVVGTKDIGTIAKFLSALPPLET